MLVNALAEDELHEHTARLSTESRSGLRRKLKIVSSCFLLSSEDICPCRHSSLLSVQPPAISLFILVLTTFFLIFLFSLLAPMFSVFSLVHSLRAKEAEERRTGEEGRDSLINVKTGEQKHLSLLCVCVCV